MNEEEKSRQDDINAKIVHQRIIDQPKAKPQGDVAKLKEAE